MRKTSKLLSALLAVLLLISAMSVTAFADDNTPTYTINIPTSVTLEYGKTDRQYIGEISVSDPQNFVEGQRVFLGMVGTNLKNGDHEIAVTYTFDCKDLEESNASLARSAWVYEKSNSPTHGDRYPTVDLYATITADAWESAAPGTYTATVTYSFAVK